MIVMQRIWLLCFFGGGQNEIKLISRNNIFLFPTSLSCPYYSLVLGDALCPASNSEFQVFVIHQYSCG